MVFSFDILAGSFLFSVGVDFFSKMFSIFLDFSLACLISSFLTSHAFGTMSFSVVGSCLL